MSDAYLPNSDEDARLAALLRYHVLDTHLEKQFDDIARLASQVCDTPMALISLVDKDRQWFKAKVGVDVPGTSRDISACHYTIMKPDLHILKDMREDERFKNNPMVIGAPYVRFYAGAPLNTPSGYRVGTVCVLDTKPRELTPYQQEVLVMLSNQVVTLLELRLAQATAAEAVERINLALDSGAIVGSWVWDVQEDRVTGDERFARAFDLDAEEMRIGKRISDVVTSIHPDDVDDVRQTISDNLITGGSYRKQYRVRQPEGGWRWVEASGRVEMDAQGKPLRFLGVLVDIDEHKRTELNLAKTSQRYKVLFDSIDEGFCILKVVFDKEDKPYDIVYEEVNPGFEKHTGMRDVVGRSAKQILGEDYEDHWVNAYGEVVRTGRPVRFINKVAALEKWFEVSAFRIGEEGNYRAAVIFNNITERHQAEVALQESEANLKLMLESAHEYAIISTDPEGIIQRWNSGAESIFGIKAQEMIGKTIDLIFTEEDRQAGIPDQERRVAAKHGRASDERWHTRSGGDTFYASGIMAAMHNENQVLTGFVKIARDMTEQQRNQEALLEARNAAEAANIAKTEFLANMSHEIRTPMNAVIGLSNILALSKPLTEQQQQYVKTLQMSADALLLLINDLLDISKIEARSVELEQIPFSIPKLVKELEGVLELSVREKGLAMLAVTDDLQDQIHIGDPHRLRQILLNLLSNAVKFTENGSIKITVTSSASHEAGIEDVRIAIQDTGIGIHSDKLASIFDKFVQADTSINRKYGGTGLGLAITKTITEIMGGTIQVESTPGKGSTFSVCLPFRVADKDEIRLPVNAPPPIPLPVAQREKATLLLVEDYAPNVLVATTVLDDFGYTVDVASNGTEAISMVQNTQYCAVLMDVQMHGMNGLDATRAIREYEERNSLPRLPIIGMTAHALIGDRERCIAAGMDDYISKPFNQDELREKLESMVRAAA